MVREAAPDDLAGINRIENLAIEGGFAHFGLNPLSLEDTASAFHRDASRYPWFVKIVEHTVVGFARATPWKSREAYRWTAEVGVYVDSSHQGGGYGRELYDRLFEALAKHGFHCIVAGIALPNEPSVRLHESMGMRSVGTFPEMGYKMGAWRSVGYWAKVLNDAVPSAI
jgi:phosphinothricin acetyltransferase